MDRSAISIAKLQEVPWAGNTPDQIRANQGDLTIGVITHTILPMTQHARSRQSIPATTGIEQEVLVNLMRATAALEHEVAEWLKQFGLTLTQYNALRILRGAGPNGLCRNAVRDRMIRRVPDTTRLLERLVEAGLVAREREGADKRFVIARISQKGLALLAEIDEPLARIRDAQLGHMSTEDLHTLSELLVMVRSKT